MNDNQGYNRTDRTIGRPLGLMALMGLMALGLAGCSSHDHSQELPVEPVEEEELVPIAFSGHVAESEAVSPGGTKRAYGTRAVTPLEEKATAFNVWCYKNMTYEESAGYTAAGLQVVMPGYHVTWQENTAATTATNSDGWEYMLEGYPEQSIKFWDFGAIAYRFIAATGHPVATEDLVAGQLELSMPVDGDDLASTSYFSRLWFSTGSYELYPTRQFGKTVVMSFALPLARVRFILRAVYDPSLPAPVVDNVSYKPESGTIAISGTFKVTYPLTGKSLDERWSTSDIKHTILDFTTAYTEDVNYTAAEAAAYNSANSLSLGDEGYKTTDDVKTAGTYKWYNVVPVRGQSNYVLTLRINGEEKTAVVPAAYMDWLPGYEYTYVFKVSQEGGVVLDGFNAGYSDWKEGTEADPSVYNW